MEQITPDDHVCVQTFPNYYVGPRVSITIHVREKDAEWITVKSLQKRIILDIEMINAIEGEVESGINYIHS